MINNATSIVDLRVPPANHLEKLGGDREGQWSIRINDQGAFALSGREAMHIMSR